jgi:uncharacterized membrane protein SirB2
MGKRPQAVDVASWLFWTLVAGGLAVSVFVVLRRHEIADHWSPLHPDDSSIQPVSFVPVVLVLYAVIALTVLILVSMFRQAQSWTRYALMLVALGLVLGCFAIMRTAPPTSVRIALVVAAVLSAVTLVFLWHPSITAFVRGSEEEHDEDRERSRGAGQPRDAADA